MNDGYNGSNGYSDDFDQIIGHIAGPGYVMPSSLCPLPSALGYDARD